MGGKFGEFVSRAYTNMYWTNDLVDFSLVKHHLLTKLSSCQMFQLQCSYMVEILIMNVHK